MAWWRCELTTGRGQRSGFRGRFRGFMPNRNWQRAVLLGHRANMLGGAQAASAREHLCRR
uniref:Uncharacterized protein n=1 Tax=Oryza meridionalis TaxID=40149 RepID=A0A0E0EFV5_9ORYZ